MAQTGQPAEVGVYQCLQCKHKVHIRKEGQRLPICRHCGGARVRWRKLA